MSRLEERVGSYLELTGAMTEKERAEAESEIWALVSSEERSGTHRAPWLARRLGGPAHVYASRCALILAGEATRVLWERVEGDMTLRTAQDILCAARKSPGSDGRALGGAVARELARYDALPYVRSVGAGKVSRQRSPLRAARKSWAGKSGGGDAVGMAETRAFWTDIRTRVVEHVKGRIVQEEHGVGAVYEIVRDLERDLLVLSDEYQGKIERARKWVESARAEPAVGRRAVIDACATLAMDPPEPGMPVDLKVARRHQRRQARLYHPDAHGGSEATRASYQRVMQAWETLERYNTERTGRPVLRVVGGEGNGDGHGRGTRED